MGDLLQQAIRQAVDDGDQDQYVFLETDGNDSAGHHQQVIQLTAEQAAALGISFKLEDEEEEEEQPEELQEQELSAEDSQRLIDELAQSGLLKHHSSSSNGDGCFDGWTSAVHQKYGGFDLSDTGDG